MTPPRVRGERLALLYGHSLPDAVFADRGEVLRLEADGRPPVLAIEMGGMVALRRHGLETFTPAHRIDHHRHIEALAELGCNRILALASTGSLRRDWPPGTLVVPDDFFALHITHTFHEGVEGHAIGGFDGSWRLEVLDAWTRTVETPIVDGGVYAQTDGPRFESPAEIRFLAQQADLVGMTLVPELLLAAEAGISYAAVCTVDNLANGLDERPLAMEDFWESKARNEVRMVRDLEALLPALGGGR